MKQIISFLSLILMVTICCQTAAAAEQKRTPPPHTLKELTFAYFPTAVPVSVLGETMQRDRILQINLAKHGLKLHFKPFAKGNDAMQLIQKGQVAGVSISDLPALEAVTTADMLITGFVKQSYAGIVAPQGTLIQHLRNKRIGNAYGSTSHYALLQALAAAGMSEQDITLVPLETWQMLEALENGKISAFAAWEPTPTAALKKHPGTYTQIGRQTSYAFFLVSGQLRRTNPDAAREITAALVRAINWLKKDNSNLLTASRWVQSGVQAFTGKPSALNESEIARVTRTDLLDIAGAPRIPQNLQNEDSLLFKELAFLVKIGRLPAQTSSQQLKQGFSDQLLLEVLAAPARYGLNRYDYDK